MRRVSDVRPGALIQEVEIPPECSVIEALIKHRSSSATPKNIGGQGWRMLWIRVLGDIDITDDDVNYLWLCQYYIAIVLLLNVDPKVIFYISPVFNVQTCILYLFYHFVDGPGVRPQ